MRYKIEQLERRVRLLEASRLRPNLSLADQALKEIMVRIERAKELSTRLFSKGLTLKDASMALPYTQFPAFKTFEDALKNKDHAKARRGGRYVREWLDEEWSTLKHEFGYMMPAITQWSHTIDREDVWGESGVRKLKMAWNKFKKIAKKNWEEYLDLIEGFEDLENEHLTGGLKIQFVKGFRGTDSIARVDLVTGVMSINLSNKSIRNKKTVKAVVEHELVHYEQHLKGITGTPNQFNTEYDFFVEHSLRDIEFDPRLNDLSNAVSDLIELGYAPREAIDLLNSNDRKPSEANDFLFDSAQQWLSVLKKHDRRKYTKALKEVKRDYL
jgi:hypothetical protein